MSVYKDSRTRLGQTAIGNIYTSCYPHTLRASKNEMFKLRKPTVFLPLRNKIKQDGAEQCQA